MRKLLNGRAAGSYLYLMCAVGLGCLWQCTEYIKDSMNDEKVYQLPSVKSTVSAADIKGLRGVSEKSPAALRKERALAAAEANSHGDVDVDAVFGDKKQVETAPPPPKFEFDKFFRENAALNAVSSNGAVINGHFFELGSDMELLAVVGEQGNKVVPVLRAVGDRSATVSLGKKSIQLSLHNTGAM